MVDIQPTPSNLYYLNFPAMLDWNPELWTRINHEKGHWDQTLQHYYEHKVS